MYNAPDRNYYTPIITALAYSDKLKEMAPRLIHKILSYLAPELCVSAIKHTYCGLPAIEYDIKSKKGIIVEVSSGPKYSETIINLCIWFY